MLQEVIKEDHLGRVYHRHDAAGALEPSLKCDVCLLVAKWAAQPASTSRYSYACDQHLAEVMSMTGEKCYLVVHPLAPGSVN